MDVALEDADAEYLDMGSFNFTIDGTFTKEVSYEEARRKAASGTWWESSVAVQISYGKVIGSPEKAEQFDAVELHALHSAFSSQISYENSYLSDRQIERIAMDRTKKTMEEMIAVGIMLAPATSTWEEYKERVRLW